MPKRKIDLTAPLQSLPNAARLSGLSVYSLRQGVKSGAIPCVHVGREARIFMPLLLEKLEREAAASVAGAGGETGK